MQTSMPFFLPYMQRTLKKRSRITSLGEPLPSRSQPLDASVEKEHQWVHFVGIGGSGLSSLALVALKQGWRVSGSDLTESSRLEVLRQEGATVFVGHDASQVTRAQIGERPDALVVSSAVKDDNAELAAARELGIPIFKRDAWLGRITEDHQLIAVAGSHGKTTTSAMLALTLLSMGDDVTAVIGGEVPQFPDGNSALVGQGPRFVLEADEYDSCFLGVAPLVAIVTSVEWEHVDIFPNEAAVRTLFRQFVQRIKPNGALVVCGDSAGSRSLATTFQVGADEDGYMAGSSGSRRASWLDRPESRVVVTYGLAENNDWRAIMLVPNPQGGTDYIAVHQGMPMARVNLRVPGTHNVLNSLSVVVVAAMLAASKLPAGDQSIQMMAMKQAAEAAARSLGEFEGVRRRFEPLGRRGGLFIVDDYAHHPTEVRATLQAARQRFDQQPLWVVFQPHTYSRLEKLLPDFAPAFSAADRVIVTEVYASREEATGVVGGEDLADAITGPPSIYIKSQEDVIERLVWEAAAYRNNPPTPAKGDIVLLILGAGDVVELGPKLLRALPDGT